MQAVTAADGPSRHHGDDHLVHETDLTLDVEDVESVDAILALVSRVGTDVLVPAAAKRPTAVLGRRAFSSDEHHPYVLALVAGDEGFPKLVHRLGREGVSNLRTIERNACDTLVHFEGDFVVFLDGFPGKVGHDGAFKRGTTARVRSSPRR